MRSLSIGVGVACVSVLTLCSVRVDAAQSPQAMIRTIVEQAMAVLKDPAYRGNVHFQQRLQKLEDVILPHIDAWEFGRRCLGIHWQKLSEAQRQEFIRLFTDLVEKTYGGMLESYPQDVRFTYDAERVEGEFAEVDVRVFGLEEKPIAVTYRLHQNEGKWLIYDVVVENVSMVSNYRNQFNRIINRSSYEGLVEAIKRKLVQLRTAPAS